MNPSLIPTLSSLMEARKAQMSGENRDSQRRAMFARLKGGKKPSEQAQEPRTGIKQANKPKASLRAVAVGFVGESKKKGPSTREQIKNRLSSLLKRGKNSK